LTPLATGRFQQWRSQHYASLPEAKDAA
jgi:hypothetical protein